MPEICSLKELLVSTPNVVGVSVETVGRLWVVGRRTSLECPTEEKIALLRAGLVFFFLIVPRGTAANPGMQQLAGPCGIFICFSDVPVFVAESAIFVAAFLWNF